MRNTINRFQTSDNIYADIQAITEDIECNKDNACEAKKTLSVIEKRASLNQGRLNPRDVKARKDLRARLTSISNRVVYLNRVLEDAVAVRDTRKVGAYMIERAAKPETVTETVQPVTTAMVAPVVNSGKPATAKPLPFLGRRFNLTDPTMSFDRKAATFTVKMAWAKRAKSLAIAA